MNKNLFLDGYIERIANKFELSHPLAFEILSLAAILDLSFDEVYHHASTIENKVGNNDGGLDGIYLEEDNEENTLHIFQVKSSKSLGDNELSKFVNDFRGLFVEGNTLNLPLNDKVKVALEKYQALVKSGRVVDTKLYFIFNGEKTPQNAPLIKRHLENIENLQIFDSNDLYEQIDNLASEGKKRKTVDFSFMAEKSNISLRNDPQALISFSIQNVKAVNFRLAALELCQLLELEKQINKRVDTIFSDNIRSFLSYNKTNKNIRNTLLSDDAEYFPFLNNGITIIAERVKIPKDMQVGLYPLEVRNPVIVNGLQTTRVIYDIYQQDKSKLEGVYVLFRLYETTDNELIDKITDATNTQSPINYRDKISNRRFNQYTKEVFANAGISYLCKRGETFNDALSISLHKSVHSETILKFWYATFYGEPEKAKGSKSKVLEELFDATTNENNKLNALFNGDKNSFIYEQLLQTFKIYDFVIQQRILINSSDDFVLFTDELIAYGVYKLFSKQGGFDIEQLGSYYQQVFDAIIACIEQEKLAKEKIKKTYSHNSYFKSAKSRFHLNDKLELSEENSIFE
ncbi:MAG: hypothetical protein GQ569_12995 [Methylococcaceae bacterium]|nr:hypothetical protein [Methylococcaceae bacterium]